MLGSGDIRHRVYISYGAMNAIFAFLQPLRVLSLQQVSKFMYHRGVERLQTSVLLPCNLPLYFNLEGHEKFADKLVKYDAKSGMAKEIELERERVGFKLMDCYVVQLATRVLVFSPSERIDVYELTNLWSNNPGTL